MKAAHNNRDAVNAAYRADRPFAPRNAKTAHENSTAASPSQTMTHANMAAFAQEGVPYRAVVSAMKRKLPDAKAHDSSSRPAALAASDALVRKTTENQTAQNSI